MKTILISENKTEKLEQMEKQMKNVIEKLDVIIAG